MRSAAIGHVLALGLLLIAPLHAAAQAAAPPPPPPPPPAAPATAAEGVQGDRPTLAPLRVRPLPGALLAAPDPRRLPVLDDAGQPIAMSEIEARIDRNGGMGILWGGLAGGLVGGLGAVLANSLVQCGSGQGFFGTVELCSPQEQALRDSLGWTAFLTGLVGGITIGWNADVVTWQEAVAKIRAERAASAGASR